MHDDLVVGRLENRVAALFGMREQPDLPRLFRRLEHGVVDARMPALGAPEHVVEAARDGMVGHEVARGVDAEHLLRIHLLLDAEILRQRQAAPADAEDAGVGRPRHVDDAAQFLPVGHLLPRQFLDRRARHDQAVERRHRLRPVEGNVVLVEVGVVGALVVVVAQANPHRNDLEDAPPHRREEVELVLLRVRHDVEDADPQRPDVLVLGRLFAQPRHVVLLEQRLQPMVGRQTNGHGFVLTKRLSCHRAAGPVHPRSRDRARRRRCAGNGPKTPARPAAGCDAFRPVPFAAAPRRRPGFRAWRSRRAIP